MIDPCSVRGESWAMNCYEGIWLVSHSDNQPSSNCNCNEILGGCNCDVTGNLTSKIPPHTSSSDLYYAVLIVREILKRQFSFN